MKTNSHINSQGKASSLRFNQIKKAILWLAGIIGAIVGLTLWAFLRPIFRGRRLGNINHQRTCDNLLDFNTLKIFTTMATTRENRGTRAFNDTIKAYLEKRADNDALFAIRFANPSKSVEDCVTYIINQVQKSGCNGFADDEIFGMALHYWEESEIEVGNPINCKVVVNHTVELTEEEKEQARQDAINKLRDEEMAKMRRPKTTEKKTTENNPQIAQPSLFDL